MLETVHSTGQYTLETCTDRDAWNEFLERNDGPAYDHWGWGEAVASYGHDHWNVVVRDHDSDSIAAALPLYHIDSRLFGSQLLSPAFAERGGIVLDSDAQSTAPVQLLLDQTRRMADERGVDFVSLRGSECPETGEFTVKNRYVTFRVPTDEGPDAAWDALRDSRQRQITQAAEDDSLRVRVGDSLSDLERYYRLYTRTMRRHGSPAHSFEFFRILWDQLYDDGNLRLSLVIHDDTAVNGMIDLSMGSSVYQWGVVNDYDYRSLNGGSLLLWNSLERAAEDGYDSYEMGRTREGSGVYLFKKSFGGTKTWYDDVHYFPNGASSLPNPDDDKYERAREVWKRLPLSVTRTVGPYVRKQIGI